VGVVAKSLGLVLLTVTPAFPSVMASHWIGLFSRSCGSVHTIRGQGVLTLTAPGSRAWQSISRLLVNELWRPPLHLRHALVMVSTERPTAAPDSPVEPELTFLGAAGTVTGSRFLLRTARATVLVECGLFQGPKTLRSRNWAPFYVDPAGIDAVVVTHAHVDHIGYLPRLVRHGFRGPVWCSGSTAALAGIVLTDAGHLQEEEAAYANRVGYSRHHPAEPLFTQADAHASLRLLEPIPFGRAHEIAPDVTLRLHPAGHILGSAIAELTIDDPTRSILFSGDLGRPNHPLLIAPAPPPPVGTIVIESTYGGRRHDTTDPSAELAAVITRTAKRGGTVVIPAFAVDRTEVILLHLQQLATSGAIPDLPIYVDSPMALAALEVYRHAIAHGADDIRPELIGRPLPVDAATVTELRRVEDSKALARNPHPSIIISASGMATGGRVLHHLTRLLPDRRNSVVLVGYQAAGTRGRSLADGATELKMFGRYVPVRAEVVDLDGFSVHADHDELVSWLASARRPPETVYVVHGEPEGATELGDDIRHKLDIVAVAPRHLEQVRLI
jgi:metallo-beta-lactamase family protein